MSLLLSYTARNKVVDSDLVVTYAARRIDGNWSWTALNMSGSYSQAWSISRYASMSFRYVGMTRDAANACKSALVQLFTRSFNLSQWNGDVEGGAFETQWGGTQLMADVSVAHAEDGAWDVVVNVREEDNRLSLMSGSAVGDLSRHFQTENNRVYNLEDL